MSRMNLKAAKKRAASRMARKSGDDSPPSTWRKKIFEFLRWTISIPLAVGFLIGISIDALSIPKSIVDFRNHLTEARTYVSGLAYRTEIWTGIFDTFPEGSVDMNDMGIFSLVDAALELEVVEGNRLDGRVWWSKSCDLGSPFSGLLLEGYINVGGSSADVIIYDFLGGRRLEFFSGSLYNDGILIHFSGFPSQSGLNGSRIAHNPEPANLENWEDLHCEWLTQDAQRDEDQEQTQR